MINFEINYNSEWGDAVFIVGNIAEFGNGDEGKALPLKYTNDSNWSIDFDIDSTKLNQKISYYYFIITKDGFKKYHALNYKLEFTATNLSVKDTWVGVDHLSSVFTKKIFKEVFNKTATTKPNSKDYKQVFTVQCPTLLPHQSLLICGATHLLGNWELENSIAPIEINDQFIFGFDLPLNEVIEYKYVIKNNQTNTFEFETGDNRIATVSNKTIIHDGFVNYEAAQFKSAGVAIPVFSLRSNNSFGVGEFTDIKLLGDWCTKVGISMVQLLPINDTLATLTNADSYPYSANSSFALHPLYLNLKEIASLPPKSDLEKQYNQLKKELDRKAELDFETTIQYKLAYARALYDADKGIFQKSKVYTTFYEANKYWLDYYAAYSYLRNKYSAVNFNEWEQYATIDAEKINALFKDNTVKNDLQFWIYVQYQLHLQLTDAVDYLHKKGIAVKGDLPIGIGRTSCDAWQHPHLFHMDMQAGAPPDDFAVKGQNWGFPTYNWEEMVKEDFAWWKARFKKMSDYFDAFRIDHILGFFRIWSIPNHAIDGTLGRFIPAIAVHKNEFNDNDIYLDLERFTQPHFSQQQLYDLFGEATESVKETFFDIRYGLFVFKTTINTQKAIKAYCETNDWHPEIKTKLINCCNNVLLFEETGSDGQHFHFNIAMEKAPSFHILSQAQQGKLKQLYVDYFYRRQDDFWQKEAYKKLPALQRTTDMLICGEDLGMVPDCVPGVMNALSILSLEVQRMPKAQGASFVDPNQVPYLSVCTPSTHDMSTIREWWEEDRALIQQFYNNNLGHYGTTPYYCEPWVATDIINQHLQAKSMWAIFQLQDLMAIDKNIRLENPMDERINVPANPDHYWCYRMHINLEALINTDSFNAMLHELIKESGRCN